MTLYGHVTLPNNKNTGFLTLGGLGGNGLSSSIYELLCDVNGCGNQWNHVGFFNGPRSYFVAYWVPDSTELTGSAPSKQ